MCPPRLLQILIQSPSVQSRMHIDSPTWTWYQSYKIKNSDFIMYQIRYWGALCLNLRNGIRQRTRERDPPSLVRNFVANSDLKSAKSEKITFSLQTTPRKVLLKSEKTHFLNLIFHQLASLGKTWDVKIWNGGEKLVYGVRPWQSNMERTHIPSSTNIDHILLIFQTNFKINANQRNKK